MIRNTGLACRNTHNKFLNFTSHFFHAGRVLNAKYQAKWNFRAEVHSRMEFGISEWKCIPEWKFRMESAFQSGIFTYVELNGPMGFRNQPKSSFTSSCNQYPYTVKTGAYIYTPNGVLCTL